MKSGTRAAALDAERIAADLPHLDVDTLAVIVRTANVEYWRDAAPTLPDPLYDRVVERLRQLDPGHPVLQHLGEDAPPGDSALDPEAAEALAPEARFGAAVRHREPMLSLAKVYRAKELHEWAEKVHGDFVVMAKLDGVACSLHYAQGRLVLAATRGNGTVGEDITLNVLEVPNVPTRIDHAGSLEVRGEVCMPLSRFAEFRAEFANPRNLTAGTLKAKESARTRTAALQFLAYDLVGAGTADEREEFARLAQLGFATVEHRFCSATGMDDAFLEFSRLRGSLDFELDGVVYRALSSLEQRRLGATGHHPRWAVAYKFQGDTGSTTLHDVVWSVSRSGTITPVARVAPVELSGAFISRVSLHHLTRFRQLGLRAGARVEVTRRGGVIPQLERVTEAGEGAPFEPPSTCPACGAAVEVRSKREGEFLTCTNAGRCSRARERALEHFAKVIDLQGFGPKAVRQLVDAGLLGTPADFYRLRADDLAQLDRLGAKAAANLVGQVEAHRVVELATFLEALGIEHLGRRNAELLAREFGSLEAIRAADATTFEALHGVKQAIAAAWVEGLSSHAGLVDDLLREVELRAPAEQVAGRTAAGPFAGMSFVFTGTLEALDRRTAQAEVLSRGGTTPDTVGRDLTYLVVGAGRGAKSTKQTKAEQLVAAGSPLRILAESEFLDMLAATGWTAPNVGS